jgi:hypothetical protein
VLVLVLGLVLLRMPLLLPVLLVLAQVLALVPVQVLGPEEAEVSCRVAEHPDAPLDQ